MSYQRGAVVLVPFPFTDLSQQQARPAIVLSPQRLNDRSADLILVAVSSQVPNNPNEYELVIRQGTPEFTPTGLRVSSVVKATRIVTMSQALIHAQLGSLADQTLRELNRRVSRALGLS